MIEISSKSFGKAIAHAAESKEFEIHGFLIGFKNGCDGTIIETLPTRKMVQHSNSFVSCDGHVRNLLSASLPLGLEIVGTYHSHPEMGVFSSTIDEENMNKPEYPIGLIIDPFQEKYVEYGFYSKNGEEDFAIIGNVNEMITEIDYIGEPVYILKNSTVYDAQNSLMKAMRKHTENIYKNHSFKFRINNEFLDRDDSIKNSELISSKLKRVKIISNMDIPLFFTSTHEETYGELASRVGEILEFNMAIVSEINETCILDSVNNEVTKDGSIIQCF